MAALTRKLKALLKQLQIRLECNRCQRVVSVRYAASNGLDLCRACMLEQLQVKSWPEPEVKAIPFRPAPKRKVEAHGRWSARNQQRRQA